MRTVKPSGTDVEEFRTVVRTSTGLRFGDDKLPQLAELLAARVSATGEASAASYLGRLRASPEEIRELARALTVSETYFLRNADQFRAFEWILRRRVESGRRGLRLLSAGCSSGEEPYSMAIVIRQMLRDLAFDDVSIVAFDVNPDLLEKARAAEYAPWSLRETPESIQGKYFRENGRSFRLDEGIRSMVRFEERNLVRSEPVFWRPEAFDVVFCRNVLMYFSPETARDVVRRIAYSLSPGGFLFLGHAENLRGLSRDFRLLHTHETFYYQRRAVLDDTPAEEREEALAPPELPAVQALAADASWVEAIAAASDRIDRLTRSEAPEPALSIAAPAPSPASLEPALRLMQEERYREALALLPRRSHGDPEGLLLRAVLLATSGEPREAEEICAELLELDELNAGAHYVLALCREHAGDRDAAVEHDRVAVYLDPDFAMPHLHLGLLARRAGDSIAARRELELARSLLSREDGARVLLFGGGFGREALIRLCTAELKACGGSAS